MYNECEDDRDSSNSIIKRLQYLFELWLAFPDTLPNFRNHLLYTFDTKNKFHAYEDKEFSIRIERAFPKRMFIVPQAKLYHYHSAGNRQSLLRRTQNDLVEVWKLFKKNGNYNWLGLDFIVLLFGLLLNALMLSLKHLNINFLIHYLKGFNQGRKSQILSE